MSFWPKAFLFCATTSVLGFALSGYWEPAIFAGVVGLKATMISFVAMMLDAAFGDPAQYRQRQASQHHHYHDNRHINVITEDGRSYRVDPRQLER